MCPEPSTAAQSLTESPPKVYCRNVDRLHCSNFMHFLHIVSCRNLLDSHLLPIFKPTYYQRASERLRFWVSFRWIWPQPKTSPSRQIPSPNQKGRFYFSAGPPSPRWPSKDNLPPPSPFCNLNYTHGARLPSPSFRLKYACAPLSP